MPMSFIWGHWISKQKKSSNVLSEGRHLASQVLLALVGGRKVSSSKYRFSFHFFQFLSPKCTILIHLSLQCTLFLLFSVFLIVKTLTCAFPQILLSTPTTPMLCISKILLEFLNWGSFHPLFVLVDLDNSLERFLKKMQSPWLFTWKSK